MPWLLLLHIIALLCWCGSLLYLPALIVGMARREAKGRHHFYPVARGLLTHVATPAALIAIISGTVLFLFHHVIAFWLLAKLTLVSGLVLCHVLTGGLVLRVERGACRHARLFCLLLGMASIGLIVGILSLVLAKPG